MKLKLRVPASSANIGPGFDCLGLAVNVYIILDIEEKGQGINIISKAPKMEGAENLLLKSMWHVFDLVEYTPKGLTIKMENNIPLARGLGSSAALIVGGILAANKIAQTNLSQDQLLNIANKIEGHPDNVTPCLIGGLTASLIDGENVYFSKLPVSTDLCFYALIPDFYLSTKVARGALPKEVPHKDAVFNVNHSILTLKALANGDLNLLKISLQDKLHQNYRLPLIPEHEKLINSLQNIENTAYYLSGAGPTIMVVAKESETTETELQNALNNLQNPWNINKLRPDLQGAVEQ